MSNLIEVQSVNKTYKRGEEKGMARERKHNKI